MTARLLQKQWINDVAHALSRAKFWEAERRQFAGKLLILLVGAQGLEPWTR
jgi:hypothetical protein